MVDTDPFQKQATAFFRGLQDRICNALETLDGAGRFRQDSWERGEGEGGGGRTRVMVEGDVLEKAGVNFSEVFGEMAPELAAQVPGEGRQFTATGISLVLHPRNPMVPTVHANFRYLTKGDKQLVWRRCRFDAVLSLPGGRGSLS